ncbi:hypothetical protein [Segeticoccus rhizosphaerae]|uniref:hypothetical protein n=1 Tax=Segeticoccus rhizosphaerae TaxID=1104777 RepID=UPI0010C140FA|nr:hypothetical protein [Ornithinicoccus soli]
MRGDHQPGAMRLGSVEVMTVPEKQPAGDPDRRSLAEIARLFDVVGREAEVIRQIDGSLAHLHQVQQAKAALTSLTAAELRAAIERRRAGLGGETA